MGSTVSTPACSLNDAATALALAMLGVGIQLNSAVFTGNCDSAATLSSTGLDYVDRQNGVPSGSYFSTGAVDGTKVFYSPYSQASQSTGALLNTAFSTTANTTGVCTGGFDATSLRMDVTLGAGYTGYTGGYIYGTDEGERVSQPDAAYISIDGNIINSPQDITSSLSSTGQGTSPEYWHFAASSSRKVLGPFTPASYDSNIIEVTICDANDPNYDSAVAVAIYGVAGVRPTTTTTSTTTTTTTSESTTTTTSDSTTSDTTTTTSDATTTTSALTTTTATTTSAGGVCLVCTNNPCLSSILAATTTTVGSDCSNLIAGGNTPAAQLPSYFGQCTDDTGAINTATITSACTCLAAITNAAPTTTSTATSAAP